MQNFFVNLAIMSAAFFPLFLAIFAALWKLRTRGLLTLLLTFAVNVALLFVGLRFAPGAMHFHGGAGMSPLEMGISMGCWMPVVYMVLYHLRQAQTKAKAGAQS